MEDLQKIIHETLLTKSFSVKEADLTYRTVNHWSSEGLVDHFRKEKGDWHKLSFLELVEILIYKELRDIGFSISKMKKIKTAFESKGIFSISDLNMKASSFLIAIIKTISGGNMFLVLDRDGDFYSFSDVSLISNSLASSGLSHASEYFNGCSQIIISLRKIFAELEVKGKNLTDKFSLLMLAMKEHHRQTVNIEISEGKINKFEHHMYMNNLKNVDLLSIIKKPNQDIKISTDDYGGISAITVTKKYK